VSVEARVRESFALQGLMQTLCASVTRVAEGEVEISMPISSAITQQHGFVHAAAITAIMDSACGYAALSLMPEDIDVLAVEFKVNFVAPATGSSLRAVGTVIKAGKTITLTTANAYAISSEGEKLVAVMQATMIRSQKLTHV
jgi:uncharacterized protein (TIGR00369 family)